MKTKLSKKRLPSNEFQLLTKQEIGLEIAGIAWPEAFNKSVCHKNKLFKFK